MYNRAHIEARVLELFDEVRRGNKIEDSLVELKASWIDPYKAARRIAAHANSARGESVLWVIGIDENSGVCKINTVEIADWWAQVKKYFDGIAPSLKEFVVHTEEGPVYALCFDTTASPFVVKNPCFGKEDAGPVEREVPWREGTAVISATREQLIRMLTPVSTLPDVEILSASVDVDKHERINLDRWGGADIISEVQKKEHFHWQISVELYVSPHTETPVVLPVHRSQVGFKLLPLSTVYTRADKVRYQKPGWISSEGFRPDTASVTTSSGEAIFYLSGLVYVKASVYGPIYSISEDNDKLLLFYSAKPTGTEYKIYKEVILRSVEISGNYKRKWVANKVGCAET